MNKIVGLITAPFTPFKDNGEVNYSMIAPYCEMFVRNGVSGVFLNGSSGEGQQLTNEERKLIVEEWIRVAPADFKVMVHVGANSTIVGRELAEHAQKLGAWGTGVMAPTFPKPGSVEALLRYFEEIAIGAPDLPFYYYHIPALTGVNIPCLDILKAVDGRIDNFAGIKYTYDNLYEFSRCFSYKEGKYDLLHGLDETLLAGIAMTDVKGGIGGTYNYAAGLYSGIHTAFRAGDMDKARELQNTSLDLIDVICKYRGNIVGGKKIMKFIGLDLGGNRTPWIALSAEEEAALKSDLDAIDFSSFSNK